MDGSVAASWSRGLEKCSGTYPTLSFGVVMVAAALVLDALSKGETRGGSREDAATRLRSGIGAKKEDGPTTLPALLPRAHASATRR